MVCEEEMDESFYCCRSDCDEHDTLLLGKKKDKQMVVHGCAHEIQKVSRKITRSRSEQKHGWRMSVVSSAQQWYEKPCEAMTSPRFELSVQMIIIWSFFRSEIETRVFVQAMSLIWFDNSLKVVCAVQIFDYELLHCFECNCILFELCKII